MLNLAPCGDDCNLCPRYIATQSGSEERLREVALLWQQVGWRDTIVPPAEMVCYGCEQASWCRYNIRECALKRQINNCGECKDYPCEKIKKAFEQTNLYAKKCQEILPPKDYEYLRKTFFSKRENLDRVNKK